MEQHKNMEVPDLLKRVFDEKWIAFLKQPYEHYKQNYAPLKQSRRGPNSKYY